MKKKIFLLTIVILVLMFTFTACYEPQEEESITTSGGYEQDSNNTPSPPTKTAKEVVTEYLLAIGNNFSVSAEIKSNIGQLLTGGQKYELLADGNKMYFNNNGEIYFIEEGEDCTYIYTNDNNTWSKQAADEDYQSPTDMSLLVEMLDSIDWKSYDSSTNVAEGTTEFDGNDLFITCTLNKDNATIMVYKIQHSWIFGDSLINVGHIDLYDIGSTAVTLPEL